MKMYLVKRWMALGMVALGCALAVPAQAVGHGHGGYHGGGGWHGGGGGWHGGGGGWGWWGGGWGVGLGVGLGLAYAASPYLYYPGPGYYYPYSPAPLVVEAAPVAAAPLSGAQPSGNGSNWYYCDAVKGYYPYVTECPQPWRVVPATPPGAVAR